MCIPLSNKFFPESTGKNCENWLLFSEDVENVQ